MSRVLVTGASGFVGLPLLRELAAQGGEVHALSRASQPPALEGVSWHRLDLGDGPALAALLDELRPERLVHAAWYVEHGHFWAAPENVPWVEYSLRLLRAFVAAGGRRAVMLGTCAEYDWSAVTGPLSERDSPLGPASLYGVAKDSLRRLALAYAESEGVELAWARLFFQYGPREAPARLVASVIRSLLAGERAETASGTQRRDFLHIDDVAAAIAALLASGVVGAVNIGSGEALRQSELAETIAQLIGRPDLLLLGALPDRPGEPDLLVADTTRLREEVGFRPRIGLQQGLRATVEWWSQGAAA
jgi:nucleoside-diphosphate-sugar epimerase